MQAARNNPETTAVQLDQLKQFSVCQVSDALGPDCVVETALNPLDSKSQICGRAFTVKCEPDDNLTLHHALHLAEPGDVLVVESGIGCRSALWGELMSISAASRGLAGTVIDGAARDRLKVQQIGYPVFGGTCSEPYGLNQA
jgi:4-hydroxy-4-methyl-2-oxoglutarate aldolase